MYPFTYCVSRNVNVILLAMEVKTAFHEYLANIPTPIFDVYNSYSFCVA